MRPLLCLVQMCNVMPASVLPTPLLDWPPLDIQPDYCQSALLTHLRNLSMPLLGRQVVSIADLFLRWVQPLPTQKINEGLMKQVVDIHLFAISLDALH